MKISQVIYLIQTPFSKRDQSRFGVGIFLNHKVNVKVLDLTSYIDKNVAVNHIVNSSEEFEFLEKLESFKKIKDCILNTSSDTVFISFIGESSVKSLRILNLLSKNNKEFGIIFAGSLPISSEKSSLLTRLSSLNFKKIKRLIGKLFYVSIFSNCKYSFVISSGKESYKVIKNKYKDSDIIKGHAFDYDLFLEHNQENVKLSKKYILFLDEFLPFHPDYIALGVDYSLIADSYYKKLSDYFDYLEKQFNMDVIIGAHPRSYYDKLPNYWRNRKYIIGDTINLVKNSEFCLLHASTSINFSILYEKPLLFITSNEVKSTNVQQSLESMARELNSIVIDLDSSYKLKKEDISFNKKYYENYKNKFIKLIDSENLNNWELLFKYYSEKQDLN